ncbi:MAG: ATP-binding protein [Alphaproteobacteria bacterium]
MRRFDLSGHRPLIVIFLISPLLLSAFTYALYLHANQSRATQRRMIDAYEMVRLARAADSTSLNMQADERSYALSGSGEFLESYANDRAALTKHVESLKVLAAANPARAQNFDRVSADAALVIADIDARIERLKASGDARSTPEILHRSKEVMDDFRAALENLTAPEETLLREYRQPTVEADRQYSIALIIGTALTLGSIFLTYLTIIGLIAANRKSHDSLADSKETYRLILDGIKDGIYDYSPQTGKMSFSPSYHDLLGYDASELPDSLELVIALLHPDDRENALRAIGQFVRHEIPSYVSTFRLRHKDGSWRWILARGVGIWDERGVMERMVGTHTDITDQKTRNENSEQFDDDMSGVVYVISHDLRTPLVNLRGFTSEIERSLLEITPLLDKMIAKAQPTEEEAGKLHHAFKDDIPEAIDFIHTSVERMDRLTNNILDLARIDQREYERGQVDCQIVVNRCIENQSYEIRHRNVEIICERLPTVLTDAAAFEQILANILDNAIKYAMPNRKSVVKIRARQLPWETIFSVEDNGRGIAAQDKQKVFDIFRRAGNTTGVRGAGMGMAYVKAILRRLGGRIWFDSVLNEGSTFHFTIPAAKEERLRQAS